MVNTLVAGKEVKLTSIIISLIDENFVSFDV